MINVPSRRRAVLGFIGAVAVGPQAIFAKQAYACSGSYSDGVFHTINLRQFAQALERTSNGDVQLEVTPNAQLMPMGQVLPSLSAGKLAFGEVLMSSYGAEDPLLAFDSLPFVLNNVNQANRMWEVSRKPIEEALLQRGVRVLYAVPWPAQNLFSRIPITRLEDLKGLRFRVYNDTSARVAEAAGAAPVAITAADLPSAVEAGRVDAMITSSITAVDCQAWRSMTNMVACAAWVPKNMVCISEAVWKSLNSRVQSAVMASAREAEERGWRMSREADEQAQKLLIQKKVQIVATPPELRRSLEHISERACSAWSRRAGFAGSQVFLSYYSQKV